jgi:predicted amidophosphoribosyltransferase
MNDRACAGCRQVITDDPSGLCEDCQTDVLSQRPGSITDSQRLAIAGLVIDQNLLTPARRDDMIGQAVPGWKYYGDLGALSQQQAGDVLELLEDRRRSQEVRGL